MTVIEINQELDVVQRRLERQYQATSRLLGKIKSYRFEPKDYSCFQLMQQIKFELGELLKAQEEIIQKIKSKSATQTTVIRDSESLFYRFKKLEKRMAEYLLKLTS